MIEYHLRAVSEVAELRLPQRQRVGLGERIAVFKAEHRLFRKHRVDDLEATLILSDVIEWDVAALRLLIDQHRMPLRERPALAVLPGQPHRMALDQQRAQSERLARRPVDALAALDRLGAGVEKALDGAVDVEILGHRGDLLADFFERLDRDA